MTKTTKNVYNTASTALQNTLVLITDSQWVIFGYNWLKDCTILNITWAGRDRWTRWWHRTERSCWRSCCCTPRHRQSNDDYEDDDDDDKVNNQPKNQPVDLSMMLMNVVERMRGWRQLQLRTQPAPDELQRQYDDDKARDPDQPDRSLVTELIANSVAEIDGVQHSQDR